MEGGKVSDFIDTFTYQSVAMKYQGEKYFSDGIVVMPNGQYSFFIIKVTNDNQFISDVYSFVGKNITECLDAFESAKIWNGKTFYEAEKEIEWVDW